MTQLLTTQLVARGTGLEDPALHLIAWMPEAGMDNTQEEKLAGQRAAPRLFGLPLGTAHHAPSLQLTP